MYKMQIQSKCKLHVAYILILESNTYSCAVICSRQSFRQASHSLQWKAFIFTYVLFCIQLGFLHENRQIGEKYVFGSKTRSLA